MIDEYSLLKEIERIPAPSEVFELSYASEGLPDYLYIEETSFTISFVGRDSLNLRRLAKSVYMGWRPSVFHHGAILDSQGGEHF